MWQSLVTKIRKGAIINIFGLLLGLFASIIILLFVKYENSFDSQNSNFSDIYRIRSITYKNGAMTMNSVLSAPPMGETLVNSFPEIMGYVRIFTQKDCILEAEQKKMEVKEVAYIDNSIFDIFTINLISGDPQTCLQYPNTAILSESMASAFFGKEDPIGKTLKLNNDLVFKVTGIYKDFPTNSHIHFQTILSYNTPNWLKQKYDNTWDMFFVRTYLLLNKGANIQDLEKKCTKLFNENKPESYGNDQWEMKLQPLSEIHLNSQYRGEIEEGGNGKMNNVLIVAAFLILVIAWLNYINLATAQSLDRAKEVGICKVVGFSRSYLIIKFLKESLIINIIAVIISLAFVLLIKPYIANVLQADLSFAYWDVWFIIKLLLVFILGAFLAGIYPAFILSSFNPIQTLRGKVGISTGGAIGVRKVLLGFQFGISTILIFFTLVIHMQSKLMLNKDLGIDLTNILVIKGENLNTSDSISIHRIESFKDALRHLPEVKNVASTNSLPANAFYTDDVYSDIQQKAEKSQFSILHVDYEYFNVFDLKPVSGRVFSRDFLSDINTVVVSRAGSPKLGFNSNEEIINHKVDRNYGAKGRVVIGVVDDIQISSWQTIGAPSIFFLDPEEKRFIAVKLNSEINLSTTNKIKKVWGEYFPNELFRYFDLDESYKMLYKNEVRNSNILAGFSLLAIIVACIGLWGLAQFTIIHRRKEIGIRKILGFKAMDIVDLINREFLTIVLVACLISIPIAWYLSSKWLESYAVKINLAWWMPLVPFLFVSLITVLMVSFYTIKTAIQDPAKAIKED